MSAADNTGRLQRNFTQGRLSFSPLLAANPGFVASKYVPTCPVLETEGDPPLDVLLLSGPEGGFSAGSPCLPWP